MRYDLSIILPSIRTHLLENFYNSIFQSIENYTFELIVIDTYK